MPRSRNVLRRTGSTQLRQRLVTQRAALSRCHSLRAAPRGSPRMHTRVTAYEENVAARATVDINNTRSPM